MNRLMIIPAAGLGTRLSPVIPKVLFPVNGRPMVDYLFDLYKKTVDRFILVLHPSFAAEVVEYCAKYPLQIEYELQESSTGMLDAILIPRERIRTHAPRSVWVTWCDQIAVHPETVRALADFSNRHGEAALIFPTIVRRNPYIHLVRNGQREIVRVLHLREGDDLPPVAESDMGLFCMALPAYLDLLGEFARGIQTGAVTRERNFLPFIAWLRERAAVHTFPGRDEIESIGVNTAEELRVVEDYLRLK